MTQPKAATGHATAQDSALAARLKREITGDVLFDAFSTGRYATDASFYQINPLGVVVPRTMDEALRAMAIARDDGRIVTPRGGGTSQCGQTVNEGIVIDVSKHLNKIISLDIEKSLEEWKKLGLRRTDGGDLPVVHKLAASLVRPDDTTGPAYLVYGNYKAIMKWNRSTYFATAVGTLSDRIEQG